MTFICPSAELTFTPPKNRIEKVNKKIEKNVWSLSSGLVVWSNKKVIDYKKFAILKFHLIFSGDCCNWLFTFIYLPTAELNFTPQKTSCKSKQKKFEKNAWSVSSGLVVWSNEKVVDYKKFAIFKFHLILFRW